MRKLILTSILLLMAIPCYGQDLARLSPMMMGAGVAAAGCAGDTLTIGDNDPSGASAAEGSNEYLYFAGYLAVATCTIDTIEIELANSGTAGRYIRVAVYADNGSGAATGDDLGQSAAVATNGDGNPQTLSLTISPAVPMTNGNRYHIAVWHSHGNIQFYHNGDVANGAGYMTAAYHATNDFPTVASFTDWDKQIVVAGFAQ